MLGGLFFCGRRGDSHFDNYTIGDKVLEQSVHAKSAQNFRVAAIFANLFESLIKARHPLICLRQGLGHNEVILAFVQQIDIARVCFGIRTKKFPVRVGRHQFADPDRIDSVAFEHFEAVGYVRRLLKRDLICRCERLYLRGVVSQWNANALVVPIALILLGL